MLHRRREEQEVARAAQAPRHSVETEWEETNSRGLPQFHSKSLLAYAQHDYKWSRNVAFEDSADVRPLGTGEMRLRVDACAICGSDVKMFHGSQGEKDDCFYWGKHGRVRNIPVVPGHEFVGTIEEIFVDPTISADGARFSKGDRVRE